MGQQSKSKRVTRIEVIIIVFISLLILGIILPVFNYARTIYFRMRCGTNLTEICFALLIYSNDYEDKFPRTGGESSVWNSRISDWRADDRYAAYNLNHEDGSEGEASITSNFFLLIKYAEASPKIFICPGDKGVTEFKLVDYGVVDKELTTFWDFGPNPREHCSYSYHMPYGLYPLTSSSKPGMAVAADPNPWIDSPFVDGKSRDLFAQFNPDAGREAAKVGNAVTHEEEGQNVLFMGGYTGFEEIPLCAVNDDNIYTFWDGVDIRRGGLPLPGASEPSNRLDSFLVNDGRVAIGPKPLSKERTR